MEININCDLGEKSKLHSNETKKIKIKLSETKNKITDKFKKKD